MREAYEIMKIDFPKMCEFEFWRNGKGIFPWGITDNGDELFWNYKDDSVEIVIFSSRYSEKQIFSCSMSEFLVDLLEKKKERLYQIHLKREESASIMLDKDSFSFEEYVEMTYWKVLYRC